MFVRAYFVMKKEIQGMNINPSGVRMNQWVDKLEENEYTIHEGGDGMNRLGLFLRKLRLEHNEVLFDMAQRLGVSSAFLSAVENDRKSAPLAWVDIIAGEYQLTSDQKAELEEGIGESIHQIRVNVTKVSSQKKECALAFARNFDDFSEQDISDLMSLLEKRRK